MMMMSFGRWASLPSLWVLYGYSMAFGNDVGNGYWEAPLSSLDSMASQLTQYRVDSDLRVRDVPVHVRHHHRGVDLWRDCRPHEVRGVDGLRRDLGDNRLLPVAHWVFAFDSDGVTGGWIANNPGAIDFAGGTAVPHQRWCGRPCSCIGSRQAHRFGKTPFRPHNLPFVMLGAGLLWFGWFGFNAGSALAANGTAAVAFLNTVIATAASMLAWLFVEKVRDGHATSLGAASGVVAGLVAITPACAAVVNLVSAIAIGVAAGVICALAVGLKYKLGYDDSLDVVGVHLVGGIVGTLLIGLFNGHVHRGFKAGPVLRRWIRVAG